MCSFLKVWKVTFPDQSRHWERKAALQAQTASCSYAPEPVLFHHLFPYHMVLDREMNVVQVRELLLMSPHGQAFP